jgi:hypothetical protein
VAGEETKFVTMDLPEGQDFQWFGDLNVVALRTGLDCAGKQRALDELHRTWRRRHLSLVESA